MRCQKTQKAKKLFFVQFWLMILKSLSPDDNKRCLLQLWGYQLKPNCNILWQQIYFNSIQRRIFKLVPLKVFLITETLLFMTQFFLQILCEKYHKWHSFTLCQTNSSWQNSNSSHIQVMFNRSSLPSKSEAQNKGMIKHSTKVERLLGKVLHLKI